MFWQTAKLEQTLLFGQFRMNLCNIFDFYLQLKHVIWLLNYILKIWLHIFKNWLLGQNRGLHEFEKDSIYFNPWSPWDSKIQNPKTNSAYVT